MKLSIIIPVYNEASTLAPLLERVLAVPLDDSEIFVVDDGSDNETKTLMQTAVSEHHVQLLTHPQNRGKGTAICTALKHVTGDVVIIQDADLEYFPEDYVKLLAVYEKNNAQAVYGVRNLSGRSPLMRWGNHLMTFITNLLFGSKLNDMETCYKLIDRRLMQSLGLSSRGFEIEAEITSKLLNRGIKIHEAPIKYDHREEGKKLTPWDGIPTVKTLFKYRFNKQQSQKLQIEN
ncbi:MAG: glycosyltransferase family 2 protein [Chloroflexi bacterium]|nr:MAG: glycosyltransferase family 2 protein [Chloroflexota bacterium]